MNKNLKRIVAVSLICSNLLLCSCKTENNTLLNTLQHNLHLDTSFEIKNIPYFACWNFGIQNFVAILIEIKPSNKQNDRYKNETYLRVDYLISKEDFNDLQQATESFEAIYPYNDETYKKLNYIVESYEPQKIAPAIFKDNGEIIINEISR